eukprot:5025014-Alexandrium_andersonii.AAC.1
MADCRFRQIAALTAAAPSGGGPSQHPNLFGRLHRMRHSGASGIRCEATLGPAQFGLRMPEAML